MLLITGYISLHLNDRHHWKSQKFQKGTFQNTVDFKNANYNHLTPPKGVGALAEECVRSNINYSPLWHMLGCRPQKLEKEGSKGARQDSGGGGGWQSSFLHTRLRKCMYDRLGLGLPWISRKILKVSQMIVVMWLQLDTMSKCHTP